MHPSPEKQLVSVVSGHCAPPPRRTVTKVTLQQNPAADGGGGGMMISPWNSRTAASNNNNTVPRRPDSTSSSDSSNGNTTPLNWPAAEHPFAQRAQVHYHQRQRQHQQQRAMAVAHQPENDVTITTSSRSGGGGVTLSPSSLTSDFHPPSSGEPSGVRSTSAASAFSRAESADRLMLREYEHMRQRHARNKAQYKKLSAPAFFPGSSGFGQHQSRDRNGNGVGVGAACSLDESFRRILAKADNSISQAESILSSLRVESDEISPRANRDSEEEEDAEDAEEDADSGDGDELASLGSDIQTNIRRLEKTQAKINAALKTFRTVQALNESHTSAAAAGSQQQQQQQRGRRAMRQQPQQMNPRGFAANENHGGSFCSLPVGMTIEPLPSKVKVHASSGFARRLQQQQQQQRSPEHSAEKSRTAPAKMEGGSVADRRFQHASSVTGECEYICTTNQIERFICALTSKRQNIPLIS